MFWLKDSVKTHLKIILEDKIHLGLGKILDKVKTPLESKKYFNLLEEMYRGNVNIGFSNETIPCRVKNESQ